MNKIYSHLSKRFVKLEIDTALPIFCWRLGFRKDLILLIIACPISNYIFPTLLYKNWVGSISTSKLLHTTEFVNLIQEMYKILINKPNNFDISGTWIEIFKEKFKPQTGQLVFLMVGLVVEKKCYIFHCMRSLSCYLGDSGWSDMSWLASSCTF